MALIEHHLKRFWHQIQDYIATESEARLDPEWGLTFYFYFYFYFYL